jgi:hypothetical protein
MARPASWGLPSAGGAVLGARVAELQEALSTDCVEKPLVNGD